MYTFIKYLFSHELFLKQVPVFFVSFLAAELFYKFHSFTLECLAFLLTWYVVDACAQKLHAYFVKKPVDPQ